MQHEILDEYTNQLFPAQADSEVGPMIGLISLAILIVLLTRGRLGYGAYQKDQQKSELAS